MPWRYRPTWTRRGRRVREMIGETDTTSAWEPRDIDLLLAGATSLEGAAALGWQKKAARYAELTDVSESGSSRKNSQLHPDGAGDVGAVRGGGRGRRHGGSGRDRHASPGDRP